MSSEGKPAREKRIQKELQILQAGGLPEGITLTQVPGDMNMLEWEATLQGETGTPWEHGALKLSIRFPDGYPFKPPTIHFKTKPYHPIVDPLLDPCYGRDLGMQFGLPRAPSENTQSGPTVQIFYKTLTGKTVPLEVQEEESIENVKAMIVDKEGIRPYEAYPFRLVFNGRRLAEDGHTLAENNVQAESMLHMVLVMRASVLTSDWSPA